MTEIVFWLATSRDLAGVTGDEELVDGSSAGKWPGHRWPCSRDLAGVTAKTTISSQLRPSDIHRALAEITGEATIPSWASYKGSGRGPGEATTSNWAGRPAPDCPPQFCWKECRSWSRSRASRNCLHSATCHVRVRLKSINISKMM
jgi:hypothetical protein